MINKYQKLSLLSVLLLSPFVVYAGYEEVKYSCADLGYTTPYEECIAVEGAVPLLCPFYSLTDAEGQSADNKMTVCMIRSCRGYDLTDADLDAEASDGQEMRDHIEELDSCVVGAGNEELTFYKVMKCKDGSLYQNGKCDVGCLFARYPYDKHPGDSAGDVEECVDSIGHHFGYDECNDGWNGGWEATKNTANPTGKCEFASCKIQDYPYMKNPNINEAGDDVTRGETATCWIGSNPYFRYESCLEGGEVQYTKSLGVCRKQCHFSNCTKEVKTKTLEGYTFSYNEFICAQDTSDCMVGDVAVYDGAEMGYIVHIPESKYDENKEENDRLLIVDFERRVGKWSEGEFFDTKLPYVRNTSRDPYGKINSKIILKFKTTKNEELGYEGYLFPIFDDVEKFAPSGCEENSVCGVGEWYIPALGELYEVYDNCYLLYNATQDSNIRSNVQIASSTTSGEQKTQYLMIHYSWKASVSGAISNAYNRKSNTVWFPMMSFYVR